MVAGICEAAFGSVPKTAGFVGFDASKRVAKRVQLPSGTLLIFVIVWHRMVVQIPLQHLP